MTYEEGKKIRKKQRSAAAMTSFRAASDREIQLRRAGKAKEAVALMFGSQMTATRNQLRKAVADMVAFQDKLKEDILKEQAAVESRVRLPTMSLLPEL